MQPSKNSIEVMSARGASYAPASGPSLWTMPVMVHRLGVHRATIYTLMNELGLPRPVKLGHRRVAWVASEVEFWIATRERTASRQQAA